MIKTTAVLLEEYKDYANPYTKIQRVISDGDYVSVMRGLYETDPSTPPHYLAGSLYGPSYLSFEFALAYHGLIPEKVYICTSATFEKRKQKRYETPFGVFIYTDVPSAVYPYGVMQCEENGYAYQIATPEKAICDKLYQLPHIGNQNELKSILFDGLRIDEDVFSSLDQAELQEICAHYPARNVKLLGAYLKRRKA